MPQNLLGLLLFRWYGHDDAIRGEHRRAKVLYSQKMRGGISLGKRIILPLKYAGLSNSYVRLTLDHEWGAYEAVALSRMVVFAYHWYSVNYLGLAAFFIQELWHHQLLLVFHGAVG